MMHFTITAPCIGRCEETGRVVFQQDVNISFYVERGFRGSWDEPSELDVASFRDASLVRVGGGMDVAPKHIKDWAAEWLHLNQDKALDAWTEEAAEARAFATAAGAEAWA
jgi:phenolic acid decarboxylase